LRFGIPVSGGKQSSRSGGDQAQVQEVLGSVIKRSPVVIQRDDPLALRFDVEIANSAGLDNLSVGLDIPVQLELGQTDEVVVVDNPDVTGVKVDGRTGKEILEQAEADLAWVGADGSWGAHNNAYLNRTPQQWGDLVRAGHPGYEGPYPVVSVWQGGADYMVHSTVALEIVEQWTNVHGIDETADGTSQLGSAERKEYKDQVGRTRVEYFTIPGMSHGVPVDPSESCGQAGAWVLDVGVCAAYQAGVFFDLGSTTDVPGNPDGGTGPVVGPDAGPTPAGGDAGIGAAPQIPNLTDDRSRPSTVSGICSRIL